jgi:sugar lactone lactonase YvrE
VKDGAVATTVALAAPRGLAVDKEGNLFIGDGSLNRILKMSPAGILSIVAGTGTFPRMAVDSAGSVYFADSGNNRVRKVNPNGIISTVAGSGPNFPEPGSYAGDGGPATAARLWGGLGNGITIDAAGNLIFVDQGNNRIRKVIGIAAPGLIGGR